MGLSPTLLASPSFTLRMIQSKTKHDNNNGTQGNGSEEGNASACRARRIPGRIQMCQPPSERHPYPALGGGNGKGSQRVPAMAPQRRHGDDMGGGQWQGRHAGCQQAPAEGHQLGLRSPLPAPPHTPRPLNQGGMERGAGSGQEILTAPAGRQGGRRVGQGGGPKQIIKTKSQ